MTQPMPILLVPGLNCSARVYGHQVSALWPFGPVTVADHRHGETLAEIARSILASAPPEFALAGFSLGGYIAFEIMRQAPDRVRKLALLDTSARPDTPEQSERRHERIAVTRAGRFHDVVDDLFPLMVHPDRANDAALRSVCHAMADNSGAETSIRHQLAIMNRADSRGDLAGIGCPTLVLVGDHDALTPPDVAEEMAAGIPGAKLVIVPDCGHMSLIEKPEAVNKALTAWLSA